MSIPLCHLKPMSNSEFENFFSLSVQDYAREKVKSGNWTEQESLAKSRQVFQKLLPAKLKTDGAFLFTIVQAASLQNAGHLWLAWADSMPQGTAYVYDFYIAPEFRGTGMGKQALALGEQEMKVRGATAIALHVFGHNVVARALYEKSGYEITNLNMRKML